MLNKKENKLIDLNNKTINIIVRDSKGNNKYTESIKYNKNIYENLDDIRNYVVKKFNIDICPCCCYDFNTKRNILYNMSKEKYDFIYWKIDFYTLSFKEAFHYTRNNPITVVVIFDLSDGIGGTDSFSLWDRIELLKILISIIVKLKRVYKIKKNPFAELKKIYYIDEELIKAVIILGDEWKIGFITSEEIKYKKIIESTIMRKLGYKKIKNKWKRINEYYININKLFY